VKKRVFVDSDVILDHLLDRAPFNRPAESLFRKIYKGEIEGFTSPLIFSNLFYVLRKAVGADTAKAALKKLRLLLKILPMDEKTVDSALDSAMPDFEDALQYHCAAKAGLANIITRNARDYRGNPVSLFTAEEYLKSLA
jgi:predicted nucleic acid-binding protein